MQYVLLALALQLTLNCIGSFCLYPSPKRNVSFKVEINSSLSLLSRSFGTHSHSEMQWGFLLYTPAPKGHNEINALMVLSVPPVVGHTADGWENKSFFCRSKCADRDATFKKASSAMKRLFLFYIISNGRIP